MLRSIAFMLLLVITAACGTKEEARQETGTDDGNGESVETTAEETVPGAFAPWAPVTEAASYLIKEKFTPRAEEVGLPAYPGAVIIHSGRIGSAQVQPHRLNVTLATPDDQAAVVAFYRERLTTSDGWEYLDKAHVFQKGTGMDYMEKSVPTVSLTSIETDGSESMYLPDGYLNDFRTKILIQYPPAK
ncbi:MAG: hypothetical protein JXA28_12365 [Bacteroidetes bacterium]|nr:hypothetical protein [Bacteroidota bacterium]